MAAQDYTSVVQQLYISYFGRPADYFGLQNFSAQLDAMGAPKTFAEVQAAVQADARGTTALSKLVNTFNNSAESTALYGTDNSQIGISKFVAAIYQNVLGREADLAGFNFWVNAITSGGLSKANAAAAITQGALSNTTDQGKLDALTVSNKLAVATSFTTALDTPTEFNAYAGDAAAAAGRTLLANVNNTTSLTAYQATINQTITGIVGGVNPGQTFSLTAGVDTLTGTAGNDTFNALSVAADGTAGATVTNFDSIDGGAGNDTLNIYTDAGASTPINTTLGSNVAIKNIETINIINTNGAAAGLADASKYTGVTALWQVGAAANVTNLAATTTAGFRTITAAGTTLGVAAADAAASATVALDGVVEGTTLNVTSGTNGKLATVTLSGTVVDGTDTNTSVQAVNLNVTAGKDVQTVVVNTAVATALGVTNGSGKAVTTINAAGSTGAITFAAGTDAAPTNTTVSSITTGSGNDTVTIRTATAVDSAATTDVNEAINATVSTGAGNDTINVKVTGAGMTTVNAGDGNDTINVAATAQNVTVNAGAGDDAIVLARGVGAKDVIDGGAGTDVLSINSTALAAQDYEILTAVVKNVEILDFSGAVVGADASKLTQFGEFDFNANGSSIINVADTQSVVTVAGVTASAKGYVASTSATTATTYAGTLHIDAVGGTAAVAGNAGPDGIAGNADDVAATPASPIAIVANAQNVVLTVEATAATASAAGVASYVTLAGDAQSVTVALTNSTNAATSGTATADAVANFSLTTGTGTTSGTAQSNAMGNLTSITLTGNGAAVIDASAGGKLATIDASGMTGVAAFDKTKVAGGLTYTANTAVAETIKLGGGHDFVTTSSTYDKMDTISGLKLVATAASTAAAPALDGAASDDISVGGVTGFVKTTVSGATLGLALADAAANTAGNNLVFQYNGDTYVYVDNAAASGSDTTNTVGTFGNGDIVVKLTGTVDLDLLTIALNSAHTA